MTSAFSWQNSISLCPASFCAPRPNFLVIQVFLDFLLLLPVLYDEKDIFLGCQFQKVLSVFIEPFNFSFFSITGQDIDFNTVILNGLPSKQTEIISVIFETASKYCILDSFVDYDGYSISPKGFLPTEEYLCIAASSYPSMILRVYTRPPPTCWITSSPYMGYNAMSGPLLPCECLYSTHLVTFELKCLEREGM